MARRLNVYLHHRRVGDLLQDKRGRLGFVYDGSWLADADSTRLSWSLPLRAERFSRDECRGFFAGILPEQINRRIVARNLGISPENDFALLERLGGECAGAVTFMPAGQPLPEREYSYRPLSDADLAEILRELPRRPLLAGEKGVRLSLAGAQDKLAVHVSNGKISLPLGGAPSTHILKPAHGEFEGVVFNEQLCMALARAVGLKAAHVESGAVEGIDYLLVERYDRAVRPTAPGELPAIDRLHQEDFCQALNVVPEHKYEQEGGPSLKDCFALVREASSAAVLDLPALLDAAIFNYLVGNNDAHAKNFSLLYHGADARHGAIHLAPLYDVLCTIHYPELTKTMAMKLGGESHCDRVKLLHFEKMASDAALAKPLVKRRIGELAESILAKLPAMVSEHPVARAVATLIDGRCRRMLSELEAPVRPARPQPQRYSPPTA